ncbi:MAG: lipopolysaccharide biosynthesis protein [Pirellulales bacterium]|nr:lipopolysaccharide biosynthesis protein [Pirellulales bacterium]
MDREPQQTPSLDPSFSPDGLKRAVRSGTRATVAAQVASQLVSLAQLAILYRLLAPSDFGLLGMVLPLVLFLRLFTTLGLNVATVGRVEISSAQVSALFWMNVVLGAATTIVATLLAPVLVWLYDVRSMLSADEARSLLWLTVALGGTALIGALSAQHQALLERRLQLARVHGLRLAGQIAGALAGIVAAVAGTGVWALVAAQYVELAALAAIVWIAEPWRPHAPTRRAPVRELLHFGGYYTASSVLFFLGTNLDKVLVGAVFGPTALGYYSQAFNLAMKPVLAVTTSASGVMLPALGRAARDAQQYRSLVLVFYRLVAVLLLPIGFGVALVATDALVVLGGTAWLPAGEVLRVFALLILAQGFINIAGSVFASAGRADRLMLAAALLLLVIVQGIAAGWGFATYFGGGSEVEAAQWIAGGYSLAVVVVLAPYLWFCFATVGLPLADGFRAVRRPLLASCSMALVVLALRRALLASFDAPLPVLLAIEIGVGVASYALLARSELQWLASQARRD